MKIVRCQGPRAFVRQGPREHVGIRLDKMRHGLGIKAADIHHLPHARCARLGEEFPHSLDIGVPPVRLHVRAGWHMAEVLTQANIIAAARREMDTPIADAPGITAEEYIEISAAAEANPVLAENLNARAMAKFKLLDDAHSDVEGGIEGDGE